LFVVLLPLPSTSPRLPSTGLIWWPGWFSAGTKSAIWWCATASLDAVYGNFKRVDVVLPCRFRVFDPHWICVPIRGWRVRAWWKCCAGARLRSVNNGGARTSLESPGLLRFPARWPTGCLRDTRLLLPTAPCTGRETTRSARTADQRSSLLISRGRAATRHWSCAVVGGTHSRWSRRIESTPWQWVGQELPQVSRRHPPLLPGGLSSASVR